MRIFLPALLSLLVACGSSDADHSDPCPVLVPARDGVATDAEPTISSGSLTQPLQHRDANGPSFPQRFLVTTDYARGTDAPVLLYIGGESELVPEALDTFLDVADYLGANVVALEHRYYGESIPPGADPQHLEALTIDNAVEDLASFVHYIHDDLRMTGKVFALGGSYAGTLAAALRSAHPDLVRGAWASSAPMKLALDYPGYDEVAATALGAPCAAAARAAYDAAVVAYRDPSTRDSLLTRSGVSMPTDMATLLGMYSSFVIGHAQYGNIRSLCASFAQYPDAPLDGLLLALEPPYLVTSHGAATATSGTPVAAAAGHMPSPDGTGDDTTSTPPVSASQAWDWQACKEFGLFQVATSDRTRSATYQGVNADYWTAFCASIGVTSPPDFARVRATYVDPITAGNVTSIFFTNGSLDPWSLSSFLDPAELPAGKDLTVMVLADASHVEDFETYKTSGLPAAFEAHRKFAELVKGWLAE